MIGCGYSDSVGRITDKAIWTNQLVRLLDDLEIDQVSMVGNSFGGGVTLAFMIAHPDRVDRAVLMGAAGLEFPLTPALDFVWGRSEEHTSELLSLMRTSYAVFCWKKK